jgi:hypothetical protein
LDSINTFFVILQPNKFILEKKLHITNATYNSDLTVDLCFSDGAERRIDIGDFIRRHPHPQYNKYLDPKNFKKGTIENGNVTWGKNWDLIFPIEDLYAGKIS